MCNRCGSRGGYEVYEQHPYGSTDVVETLWEDCEECVGIGICPDCGSALKQVVINQLDCWHCTDEQCGLTGEKAAARRLGEDTPF